MNDGVVELAESLELSGIVAILFCGFGMDVYTFINLSEATQVHIKKMIKVMAFGCETFVFIYMGVSLSVLPRPGQACSQVAPKKPSVQLPAARAAKGLGLDVLVLQAGSSTASTSMLVLQSFAAQMQSTTTPTSETTE